MLFRSVETQPAKSLDELESLLRERLAGQTEPTVSIHCDKTVIVDEFVKVSEIGRANGYRMLLATQPN